MKMRWFVLGLVCMCNGHVVLGAFIWFAALAP